MTLEFALLDVSKDEVDAATNFRREFTVQLSEFDVPSGDLPDDPGDFDAAVVTGSWASVYWDLDWIDPLKEWIRGAIVDGLPVFGVCFGYQLLADVLGGEIESQENYELGFHTIEVTGDSRLFEGVPDEFTAFTSHSDDVVEIPPGARELASNQYSHHAFRKDRVFGVQFHPEVDMETAEELTAKRDASEERTPDATSTLTQSNFAQSTAVKEVFANFTEFAHHVSRD